MNLLDLLAIPRARRPHHPALRTRRADGSWQELTSAQLHARGEALAARLAAEGLARGERLALYLPNGPELVLAYLAALRLGAVVLAMNLAYRAPEVAHLLADAEPRLLLTDAAGREHLAPLLAGPAAPRVLLAEEVASPGAPAAAAPAPGLHPPVDGGEPALLLYTSGTTGRSKGAVLTHDNLLATVTGLLAAWGWRDDDRLLLALPLFHVHGLVVGLTTALAAGATVVLHERFDAAAVLDGLAPGGATLFFGVPTMYVRLVDALRSPGLRDAGAPAARPLSGVRLFASGSAPLAPETFAAFRQLTGHAILERYGMSETGITLSNPLAGERRPGTVGTPLPGVSVRIVDEDGGDVAPGSEGELVVRGSNVFAGYWRDPEKTAASFLTAPDGRRWFRTGDLARRDPGTGHVTLLGRRHDLVISAGFNVYPREVEEVLCAHPAVAEAAVTGMPDRDRGEVPAAWVVAADPAERLDPAALAAWCTDRLASFKIPRRIRQVEALPRNALGKVQKHRLESG
ncbi:MAG TPA: AMP-binding protein [Thermoanaerobaculia bacterium]|nr:AMP-binding protein [Thermoanaerobaculia bacterium]